MRFQLPDLPYSTDALTPFMSQETLELHHGKHHAGYIKKLNELLDTTPYKASSLRDVILSAHKLNDEAVFNNAAQSMNHELFWNSMSTAPTKPGSQLQAAIDRDFGGFENVKSELRQSAVTLFGSGWVWLVSDKGKLRVVSTRNAGTPIVDGLEPLLTLDVWEHAYYLDARNERAKYVDTFLGELLDWTSANDRFEALRQAA
jgi:Fe-Mn family superoxide dismutase